MARPVESASRTELASDVASYARVHVGLTIFSYINLYFIFPINFGHYHQSTVIK